MWQQPLPCQPRAVEEDEDRQTDAELQPLPLEVNLARPHTLVGPVTLSSNTRATCSGVSSAPTLGLAPGPPCCLGPWARRCLLMASGHASPTGGGPRGGQSHTMAEWGPPAQHPASQSGWTGASPTS